MSDEALTLIKPGLFGHTVAADNRRILFDIQNEVLLTQKLPVDAVFIGDSITEIWPLEAYFQPTEGILANRGIGGDVTPYILRRFAADVLQLLPRLVVIMAGVNNFWDLDNWLYPSQVRTPEVIEEEVVSNLTEMIAVAREQHITVAVCSILPTNILFNSNTERRNTAIQRINARLQTIARENGAIFVDYHQHFTAKDGLTLRDGFAEDGLHPRTAGYKIMADTLLAALDRQAAGIIRAR